MAAYGDKPKRQLICLSNTFEVSPATASYCAGFELEKWRCSALADHLMEWIADYALREDELDVTHGNMYVRLKEAAARVYKSDNYKRRGEIGEIALHAICRDFFDTIPIAPRVFYLTSSNDVVKSFDMVHVRYVNRQNFELWLGESKLYEDSSAAISAAIESVNSHIDQGFLNHEKLILGPQISKSIPHYKKIRDIFSIQSSLDELFKNTVFPVLVMADSPAVKNAKNHSNEYSTSVSQELSVLKQKIESSGLHQKIKIVVIYLPLGSKNELSAAFDKRLKGISP